MTQISDESVQNKGAAMGALSIAAVPPPIPKAEPAQQSQRFDKLDILRGIALCGILVMNIQSFSMIDAAYFNPKAWGDLTGANYWVWYISALFFDLRFMPMFSMLFGAGIALMSDRLCSSGRATAGVHYRRMVILLLFGVIHAYALWYGDILALYAIAGMVVYPLRNLRPKILLAIAVPALLLMSLVSLGMFALFQVLPEESRQEIASVTNPTPEEVSAMVAGYRGSWLDQMPFRAATAIKIQTSYVFGAFIMAGGIMAIGMAMYRSGYIVGTWSSRAYLRMSAVFIPVGMGLVVASLHWKWSVDYDAVTTMFLASIPMTLGGPLMTIGYIGLIMLALKSQSVHAFMRPFAAVGQMAFTNYIMHTLICTTIFYGHGFGYFGHVSRVGQALIVVAIWIAQLIYSPIWLRYFRFGPLEWLWRSLTYWKLQPMRVQSRV
jgi:uncharacterized protein